MLSDLCNVDIDHFSNHSFSPVLVASSAINGLATAHIACFVPLMGCSTNSLVTSTALGIVCVLKAVHASDVASFLAPDKPALAPAKSNASEAIFPPVLMSLPNHGLHASNLPNACPTFCSVGTAGWIAFCNPEPIARFAGSLKAVDATPSIASPITHAPNLAPAPSTSRGLGNDKPVLLSIHLNNESDTQDHAIVAFPSFTACSRHAMSRRSPVTAQLNAFQTSQINSFHSANALCPSDLSI